MNYDQLQTALEVAFCDAIRKFGISNFKRSSFFGSNEKVQNPLLKKAA
jgi:hypothetical protein